MLVLAIGLKAKSPSKVDEEWARSTLAEARRAIDAIDEVRLAEITGDWRRSYENLNDSKQTLLNDLAEVEAAAIGNHREAATVGGGGIILLLSGGMSWGDSPTELFDSISRLLEAGVIPDARWPDEPTQ